MNEKKDDTWARTPYPLIIDRRVSDAACRLWCLLYRQDYIDDPLDYDRMALLMDATERSVFRWCRELEINGWIEWNRKKGLKERFVVKSGASLSPESAALAQIRDVLESSSGTLSDILAIALPLLTPGSVQLTPESLELILRSAQLTPESFQLILRSVQLTSGSVEMTPGSVQLTSGSVGLIAESVNPFTDGFGMPQIEAPKTPKTPKTHENLEESSSSPTPSSPTDDDDDDPTVAYLRELGVDAAREFKGLPLEGVQMRANKLLRDPKATLGALVKNLRANPPRPAPESSQGSELEPEIEARLGWARAIASGDASEWEILQIAIELSAGADDDEAVARARARRRRFIRDIDDNQESSDESNS
jgi:hypothetical protein